MRIITTFFFSLLSLPSFAEQPTKLVAAADIWCPYNCESTSTKAGLIVDIMRDIFSEHHTEVVYRTMGWTSATSEAKAGQIDALIGASRQDAPDFIFPEEPVTYADTCLFTRKDNRYVFKGIPSLAAITLGVISGYRYGDGLDIYIANHRLSFERVQFVSGTQPLLQNIRKVQAGRVDVIVEDKKVMDFYLSKFQISDIRNAGCDLRIPIYVAFAPTNPRAHKFAEQMTAGLRKLNASGRLAQIFSSYGL